MVAKTLKKLSQTTWSGKRKVAGPTRPAPAQPNSPTKISKKRMMQRLAGSLIVSSRIDGAKCDMVIDMKSNITIIIPDVLGEFQKM